MPYIAYPSVEAMEQASKVIMEARHKAAHVEAGTPCTYSDDATPSEEEWAIIRAASRTYHYANYVQSDGRDWCALVEESYPGEQVLTAEEFEARWQANVEANKKEIPVALEQQKKELANIPVITHAEKRAREQARQDAIEDGEEYVELPGMTRREQEAAIASVNAQLIEVRGWEAPSVQAVHDELAMQALNPSVPMDGEQVARMIGRDVMDAAIDSLVATAEA